MFPDVSVQMRFALTISKVTFVFYSNALCASDSTDDAFEVNSFSDKTCSTDKSITTCPSVETSMTPSIAFSLHLRLHTSAYFTCAYIVNID